MKRILRHSYCFQSFQRSAMHLTWTRRYRARRDEL